MEVAGHVYVTWTPFRDVEEYEGGGDDAADRPVTRSRQEKTIRARTGFIRRAAPGMKEGQGPQLFNAC